MTETLKKVGNYKLVKKIGSGATSQVFQGRKDGEIQKYAIKMIKIKNMSKQQKEMIAKQVIIIKSIEHPNIVKLYQTLQTTNNYYLIFQFCQKGDLDKYLKDNMDDLLDAHHVRKIIKCIADAVQHLHSRGIAHRDIKLPNILLKKNLTIKLADFGFARQSNNQNIMMKTYCGTPITMAPQILQGKFYDKKCDIWSLGVILFQLIFGKLPFPIDQGYLVFITKVTSQRVKIPNNPKISQSLMQLLYGCLERDQYKRYSIQDFLNSRWIRQQIQTINTNIQDESVIQVLKKVSKQVSKYEIKDKIPIQKQKQQLQKLQKLLGQRIYNLLLLQLNKILNRHINLRIELIKLIDDNKQLKQLLIYYDYQILRKIKERNIKLRLEGQKDVQISINHIKSLNIPSYLQKKTQPSQAGLVLVNYLKKLSAIQQFDSQKKKIRYEIVMKFLDFIQNFDIQLILFFNNGYEAEISLQKIANYVISSSESESLQNEYYCPALNHITIAIECIEKEQKFREYANILKSSCQKRIDSIQREINGY